MRSASESPAKTGLRIRPMAASEEAATGRIERHIMTLSIDIGYSATKFCTETHGPESFPTAIAYEAVGFGAFGREEERQSYRYKGKKLLVGEKAVGRELITRDVEFLIRHAPLLTHHALKLSGYRMGEELHIRTGLSILNWGQRDKFKTALAEFEVDGYLYGPHSLTLYAQGQGVLFDAFGKTPPHLAVVVDIGYHTYDVLAFEDGKPLADKSYATSGGVNKLVQQLQKHIWNEYEVECTEQEAIRILRTGEVTYGAQPKDHSIWLRKAKAAYITEVVAEMRGKQRELMNRANAVIMGGGGAYLVRSALEEGVELPKNLKPCPAPYEYSNARGYLLA